MIGKSFFIFAILIVKLNFIISIFFDVTKDTNLDTWLASGNHPKCENARQFTCTNKKYYSIDGTCNNLNVGWLGKSLTPYIRLKPPIYGNGIGTPRTISSVTNKPLPNPREIAMKCNFPDRLKTTRINHMYNMHGQFTAFDMSRALLTLNPDGTTLTCTCGSTDPNCFNIAVPKNDMINQDQQCFVFTRSSAASAPSINCTTRVREQVDSVTHWLDLSQIYGSTKTVSSSLRDRTGGTLKTISIPGMNGRYLPHAKAGTCINEKDSNFCFVSGDPRVNENMVLTSYFTLWVRLHNNFVSRLKQLNPTWRSERLFQESRRICIAFYQKIVYEEWLPITLGDANMKAHSLAPKTSGYINAYNSKLNAQCYNEVGAAAFRFGHTLAWDLDTKRNVSLGFIEEVNLQNMLLNADAAYTNQGLEGLCRGALVDPCDRYNGNLVDPIENRMFQNMASTTGTFRQSLSTLNMNRGRDHGMRPYNEYRAYCGLSVAKSFDELDMPPDVIANFKKAYNNVNDIDLWTGIVAENQMSGAIVGPLAACMIIKQFYLLKFGDRLFYEHGHDVSTRFTPKQLSAIKSWTHSSLICDTLPIEKIQPNSFLQATVKGNGFVSCNRIPKISLAAWKE